jgi:hypothetical protein
LEKYDNDHGGSNRYVDLDDGEAQFSIGSPNGARRDRLPRARVHRQESPGFGGAARVH